MTDTRSGSTSRLVQLCVGYFLSYVLTGVLVKYFITVRKPPMPEIAYLFNSTVGGSALALLVVLVLGWPALLQSNRNAKFGPFTLPIEVGYIVPSGICTAVVIPTTTLMYTLPISVMVAMVIMRGSVIVISRIVDAIQIRQGILHKRVYAEENWGVVFAILAVATNVLLIPLAEALSAHGIPALKWLGLQAGASRGNFEFLRSGPAMTILSFYVGAYAIRIYIMNFYKNTRGKGVDLDNRGFFAVEQIAAAVTMVAFGWLFFAGPDLFGWRASILLHYQAAVRAPNIPAILSGVPFGIVAFFSVFIFMYKGRTATFAGLVNRLTSLLAGTTATLLAFFFFGLKFPSVQDWVSVGFILVAVWFLTRAERLRVAELGLSRAKAAAQPPAAAASR